MEPHTVRPAYRLLPDGILAQIAQAGDSRACECLLARYARLLAREVNRYAGGDTERADLESYALFGLLAAIQHYDPAGGSPFRVFATICVQRSLARTWKHSQTRREQFLAQCVTLESPMDSDGELVLSDILPGDSPDPVAALLAKEGVAALMRRFLQAAGGVRRQGVDASAVARMTLAGMEPVDIDTALGAERGSARYVGYAIRQRMRRSARTSRNDSREPITAH